jgi:hypothetical protein
LPKDLDTAIQQLDDQELERLVLAALAERVRRKKPPLPNQGQRKRHTEAVAVSLPQGKLNAVRAAFKAGVTPNRIAREFGLSRSDVQRVLASNAKNQWAQLLASMYAKVLEGVAMSFIDRDGVAMSCDYIWEGF